MRKRQHSLLGILIPIVLFCTLFLTGCFFEEIENNKKQNTAGKKTDQIPLISKNENFTIGFDRYGIFSLKCNRDPYNAEIIRNNSHFPGALVQYRAPGGDWLGVHNNERRIKLSDETEGEKITYANYIKGMPFEINQSFHLRRRFLEWTIELKNHMDFDIEIGDLAISLPFNRPSGEDTEKIFETSYLMHHFVSGYGSFIYFAKASGADPFLVITPLPGTKLEYSGNRRAPTVYIHSLLSGGSETRGTWRQKHTNLLLKPMGKNGDHIKYGFRFHWADNYDQIREILYQEGLFDVRVVPGMTVPLDLEAQFSLHTKNSIKSIEAEFPEQTKIEYLGEKKTDTYVYRVGFSRLGENMLTIHFNKDKRTYLEFFVTEPLETLVKKRSAFIVNKQQHRDKSKWYDGLFSVWDMKNKVLRGPDNTDGFDYWWGYVLACDDPALCKAPYVAAKNVVFPDEKEIEAVEYYLENFVWGGLQRTDKEHPYPYGIYGVPNWKMHRDPNATLLRAGTKNRHLDKMNIWRSYDYPHITMLYYHMYEIAKYYPKMVGYLDAAGYLERAYQTARAFFIYPYEILPWYETYKWGFYNELVILNLIESLKEEGFEEKAQWLTAEWEKKAKYMIYDDRFPYRSEYAFDRTAYESTYALAKYAVENPMKPDKNLWWDKRLKKWYSHPKIKVADAYDFMERQLKANLACRGVLEPAYYKLGADASMSYMAKMGGWAILDYALNFAQDPHPYLRLGYASYLSSWSLMNTGTEETNYGFWYPGKENDGATGWAFNSAKFGRVWIRKNMPRGPWWYDGEIDLGYGAATRIATTIVTEDPIFGLIAYGGVLKKDDDIISVIPRDGLRKRFDVIRDNQKVHIEFNRDGFAKGRPIAFDRALNNVEFVLENRTSDEHKTTLIVSGLPAGTYQLYFDGKLHKTFVSQGKSEYLLKLPVGKKKFYNVTIRREIK